MWLDRLNARRLIADRDAPAYSSSGIGIGRANGDFSAVGESKRHDANADPDTDGDFSAVGESKRHAANADPDSDRDLARSVRQ